MSTFLTRLTIGLLVLLPLHTVAHAQTYSTGPYETEQAYFDARFSATTWLSPSNALGLIRAVELVVSDQVSDRCWTGVESAKARIRAELERSGIAVYLEPLAFRTQMSPMLQLTGLGYRLGGSGSGPCAASLSLEAKAVINDDLGSLANTGRVYSVQSIASMWSRNYIATGGPNLNETIEAFVQESVDSFVADVLASRRSKEVQSFWEVWNADRPMTQAEYDRMIMSPDN